MITTTIKTKSIKNDGTYYLDTVDGHVFPDKVIPFTFHGIKLFCHRPYSGDNQWDSKDWRCSEKVTGCAIGYLRKTATEARDNAEKRLVEAGITKAKNLIKSKRQTNETI